MGGMMGMGMGGWILVWTVVAIAVVAAGGIVVAKVLRSQHAADRTDIPRPESRNLTEAKDALRRRYATGEIDREQYLQGKVELED